MKQEEQYMHYFFNYFNILLSIIFKKILEVHFKKFQDSIVKS